MAGDNRSTGLQKSYFDVIGICCNSEVILVEKILKELEGIEKISVIVPSKTVIVVHDTYLVSQSQIVKALNKARLEATVRVWGNKKNGLTWPSKWTLACGALLLLSVFQLLYHPLYWLAVAAAVVGLPPILLRSWAALRRWTLDINILAIIAVAGSIALKDYWEAGSIVFLFTIAEWLESRAGHKASAALESILSLAPQKAVLAENGVVVDAIDVKVNTILAVKAGEVVPIDGVVVDGKGEVDERSLTGEPYPVTKQADSLVWAGTINLDGYITIRTTTTAEDSAVSRMAKLVEEAQSKKSRTQKIIDKCAIYYMPIVILIAAGVALIPVAMRVGNLRHWFHLALVILVSACPCGLILSTPVATFCALTKAAKTGILIKGGDYLEDLAKLKVVAFDKTGTITKGEFVVTDFKLLSLHFSPPTLLSWVSSIESKSSHPMAAALIEYSQLYGVEPMPDKVSDFFTFPGEGVQATIDGKQIYIGSKRISSRAGCQTVPYVEDKKNGSTEGYVFMDGVCIGAFMLSDACRIGASRALLKLKAMGIKTAMLTGDNNAAAMHINNKLAEHAVDVVHAELLPEEKVEHIQELKKRGPTAMVGDGMNDAPALAAADVGISMGLGGSGVAVETGHVTLMSNDIGKVAQAISLARRTRRRVYQNIGISIVIKGAVLAVAFAGHPLLWAAVGADLGTCLLVIFNSMRLLRGAKDKASQCHRRADIDQGLISVKEENAEWAEEGTDLQETPDCCSKGPCWGKLVADEHQSTKLAMGQVVHQQKSVVIVSDSEAAQSGAADHQVIKSCCSNGRCTAKPKVADDPARTLVVVEEIIPASVNETNLQVKPGCCSKGNCSAKSRVEETQSEHTPATLLMVTDKSAAAAAVATIVDIERKPCCSRGSCSAKSRVEEKQAAHRPTTTLFIEEDNSASVIVKIEPEQTMAIPVKKNCCSSGRCTAKSKVADDLARKLVEEEEIPASINDSNLQVKTGCCSKGNCSAKFRLNEEHEPATTLPAKEETGCCSKGNCSAKSRVEETQSDHAPATLLLVEDKDSVAAAIVDRERKPCCSKGSCSAKSKVEEEQAAHRPTTTLVIEEDNSGSVIVNIEPEQTIDHPVKKNCCSNGRCTAKSKEEEEHAVWGGTLLVEQKNAALIGDVETGQAAERQVKKGCCNNGPCSAKSA